MGLSRSCCILLLPCVVLVGNASSSLYTGLSSREKEKGEEVEQWQPQERSSSSKDLLWMSLLKLDPAKGNHFHENSFKCKRTNYFLGFVKFFFQNYYSISSGNNSQLHFEISPFLPHSFFNGRLFLQAMLMSMVTFKFHRKMLVISN